MSLRTEIPSVGKTMRSPQWRVHAQTWIQTNGLTFIVEREHPVRRLWTKQHRQCDATASGSVRGTRERQRPLVSPSLVEEDALTIQPPIEPRVHVEPVFIRPSP